MYSQIWEKKHWNWTIASRKYQIYIPRCYVKEYLLVSFFLLTEYLNVMCLKVYNGIQGTNFMITSWAKYVNVIVYSVQDKQKKLVETRSLISHLVIRKKKHLSANFYFLCCFHSMCCLSEYVSEITNPFGLMRDCLFFCFIFLFCIVTLAFACVLFLCVRCKSLL